MNFSIEEYRVYTAFSLQEQLGYSDPNQSVIKRWLELGLKHWKDGKRTYILGKWVIEFLDQMGGTKWGEGGTGPA